jgi:hypothetical protein
MGNLQTSDNHNSEKAYRLNHKGGSLLKVRPALSEHTVNFSRNDLIGTVSALNLSSIEDMKGGAKLQLRNIPQRDRFSEFETSKRKNNQNGGGLSTSNADLSLLKDMILGRQHGGSVENSKENCGCGEGIKVLNLTPNMSASYNPLLSISESSYAQNGGNQSAFSGYSATSSFNNNSANSANSINSATSQNMLSQLGGSDHSATSSFNNNTANSANYSATSSFNNNNSIRSANSANSANYSATSQNMMSQLGGSEQSATSSFNNNSINTANYSATSSFNNNSINTANYSATSSFNNNNNNSINSATSQNMMSQLGGAEYSATSNNNSMRGGLSATSSIQLFSPTSAVNTMTGGGHNGFSATSATLVGAGSAASVTSDIPINYDMLMGGAKKSKKSKGKKSKRALKREEEEDTDDIDLEDIDDEDDDIDEDDEEDFTIDLDETDTATATPKSSKSKNNSMSRSQTDNSKKIHRHSSSNSSSTSTTSCSNSKSHPSSSSTYSETNTNDGALTVYRMNRAKYNEQSKKSKYLSTSSGGYSSESSNSVVNIKQFYSSDSGELYSADSNFLRNNISKNRLR